MLKGKLHPEQFTCSSLEQPCNPWWHLGFILEWNSADVLFELFLILWSVYHHNADSAAVGFSPSRYLYLKRVMQQCFNLLACPAVSPPHLYTQLEQISFQNFTVHADTGVKPSRSSSPSRGSAGSALYSCDAFWDSESNVCADMYTPLVLIWCY